MEMCATDAISAGPVALATIGNSIPVKKEADGNDHERHMNASPRAVDHGVFTEISWTFGEQVSARPPDSGMTETRPRAKTRPT